VVHEPCGLWVMPSDRPNSCEEIPFLELQSAKWQEPLIKAHGRVLEDGPDFDGELTLARLALPNLSSRDEEGSAPPHGGTQPRRQSIAGSYKLKATGLVSKVTNGLNQGVWKFWSGVLHWYIFPNGCDIYSRLIVVGSRKWNAFVRGLSGGQP